MADLVEVHVSVGSRAEAERICAAVVEARLAACAQIIGPITSTYRWQGAVERAEELLILLKTTADALDRLIGAVRAHHSYDTPEIVAVPIVGGLADYLAWVDAETRPTNPAR